MKLNKLRSSSESFQLAHNNLEADLEELMKKF